jgi:CTP synthase
VFSGTTPDGALCEIVEIPDHPWFLACQFHPEFLSRPLAPHPIFREFVRASLLQRRQRVTDESAAGPPAATSVA